MNQVRPRVNIRDRRRGGRAPQAGNRLQPPPTPRSSRRGWIVALMLAGTVVCAVVALLAFGSGRLVERLRPAPPPVTTRALNVLRPAAVRPVRVLDWLAGTDAAVVVNTTLDYNEASTAYALTLFAEDLGDPQRVHVLQQSAERMRETAPADAASLYVILGQAALVSPAFDDAGRAQVLLRTGDALFALRHKALALRDWQQASILARYGPGVPTQMRVQLLEDVAARLERAGEPARAAAAREHAAAAVSIVGGRVVPVTLPTVEPADWPEEVQPFLEQRRDQARIARTELDNGGTPDWKMLEDALLAEEGAVQNWLAASVDEPLGRQERYRRWIQQRRLIALGVFPPGAMPRIEARRAALDQIVSGLWDQREPELEDRLADLPADEAVAARRAWLERRLFVHMLGGDPQADVLTLWHELDEINARLPDDARLRLVHQADEQIETRYWRLPIGYFQGTIDAMDVFR